MSRAACLGLAAALSIYACADDTTLTPARLGDRVAAGRALVENNGCPSCHEPPDASLLSGAFSALPGTLTYAANLTPDPDTGLDSWSDHDYLAAIRQGKSNDGSLLCPTMPRFTQLSDDEALTIAFYLRSLTPVHHAVTESTCPPLKPPADAGGDGD